MTKKGKKRGRGKYKKFKNLGDKSSFFDRIKMIFANLLKVLF